MIAGSPASQRATPAASISPVAADAGAAEPTPADGSLAAAGAGSAVHPDSPASAAAAPPRPTPFRSVRRATADDDVTSGNTFMIAIMTDAVLVAHRPEWAIGEDLGRLDVR